MNDQTPSIELVGAGSGIDLIRSVVGSADRSAGAEPLLVVAEFDGPVDRQRASVVEAAMRLPANAALAVFVEPVAAETLVGGHPRAGQVVALRVVDAAPVTRLVEVVATRATTSSTLELVHGGMRSVGLTTVESPDMPGFLVDGLLRRYLNNAAALLQNGVVAPDDLDTAVMLGLGYPSGPLAMLRKLGVDRHVAVSTELYGATGDTRFIPPTILRTIAHSGWMDDAPGDDDQTRSRHE